MQVQLFRVTHWTRFSMLLQNEEDRDRVRNSYRTLGTTTTEIFANYGWKFTNGGAIYPNA